MLPTVDVVGVHAEEDLVRAHFDPAFHQVEKLVLFADIEPICARQIRIAFPYDFLWEQIRISSPVFPRADVDVADGVHASGSKLADLIGRDVFRVHIYNLGRDVPRVGGELDLEGRTRLRPFDLRVLKRVRASRPRTGSRRDRRPEGAACTAENAIQA